jgi:hypothetical protein
VLPGVGLWIPLSANLDLATAGQETALAAHPGVELAMDSRPSNWLGFALEFNEHSGDARLDEHALDEKYAGWRNATVRGPVCELTESAIGASKGLDRCARERGVRDDGELAIWVEFVETVIDEAPQRRTS